MEITFQSPAASVAVGIMVPKDHLSKATGMQGRIFSARNAIQYATILIGILLGGFLADYVFEPLMQSQTPLSLFLQNIVIRNLGENS